MVKSRLDEMYDTSLLDVKFEMNPIDKVNGVTILVFFIL